MSINTLIIKAYHKTFNRPIGEVLMLHRIGDWDGDRLECLEELKVSTNCLQRYIDERRNEYDFISLYELEERLKNSSKFKRPFICFTFDDGYRDNYTIGLPFFEKNHIPFAVFITTGFINHKPEFNFPFILERIIKKNDFLVIDQTRYICDTIVNKNNTFINLRAKIFSWPYEGFETHFRKTFEKYLTSDCFEDLMMNWDELLSLSKSPYCTIGAHTMSHPFLCNVPKELLQYELVESKDILEKKLNINIRYIAYPYGAYSEEVLECCKNNGFHIGFRANGGFVRKKDAISLIVKRKMMYEDL